MDGRGRCTYSGRRKIPSRLKNLVLCIEPVLLSTSLQSKCLSHFGHIAHMTTIWHLWIGHDVAMMWLYIYDHTIMTLQKKTRYSHMTNHMSRNVTFFLYDQQFGRIYMSKSICDHHMTNVLPPIWPIHYLTIIWPTHIWSKHMTNHSTKIVISTNLMICSGLNIKCQRFILLFISRFLRCRHIVLCAVAFVGHLRTAGM